MLPTGNGQLRWAPEGRAADRLLGLRRRDRLAKPRRTGPRSGAASVSGTGRVGAARCGLGGRIRGARPPPASRQARPARGLRRARRARPRRALRASPTARRRWCSCWSRPAPARCTLHAAADARDHRDAGAAGRLLLAGDRRAPRRRRRLRGRQAATSGAHASLLAAASLVVDYVLTVAVSLAAGAASLGSVFPSLSHHLLLVCAGRARRC